MCKSEDCPLRKNCYRINAIPFTLGQSYFVTPPYNKKTKKCSYFWKDIKKEII